MMRSMSSMSDGARTEGRTFFAFVIVSNDEAVNPPVRQPAGKFPQKRNELCHTFEDSTSLTYSDFSCQGMRTMEARRKPGNVRNKIRRTSLEAVQPTKSSPRRSNSVLICDSSSNLRWRFA